MNRRTDQSGTCSVLRLTVLCAAFFMVNLDIAIVNVALPSIQRELDFSQQNLQWVVSAYALAFGGLLLLGGRLADLLGRRRVFIGGLAIFTVASLVCAVAWSDMVLIAARGFQGFGAAVMTPAALSILTTAFAEGNERNKAIGIWSAVGASGGTIGFFLGGVLTDQLGWEWIFYINVPIGLLLMTGAWLLLPESRATAAARSLDAAGALSVTAGITVLVYALVYADDVGWRSGQTMTLLALSAVLFAAFVGIESRSKAPLIPLHIFRSPTVVGANVVGLLMSAGFYGIVFIVTLFAQDVLGYSALEAGLALLAISTLGLCGSILTGQRLLRLIDPATAMAVASAIMMVGFLVLTQISVQTSYLGLLPGLVIFGIGIGIGYVSNTVGAVAGVDENEQGLASGLITTSQLVGGALGVAILATVAAARTESLGAGRSLESALTSGYHVALVTGAGFAAAASLAALAMVRRIRAVSRNSEGAQQAAPATNEAGH